MWNLLGAQWGRSYKENSIFGSEGKKEGLIRREYEGVSAVACGGAWQRRCLKKRVYGGVWN